MGCGCRKNKNNRISRTKVVAKQAFAARLKATAAHRQEKVKRKKVIEQKLKFCKSCPQSTQTREERRSNTKVCHKANVSIQGILNNQKFKCPLGNF